MRGCFSCADNPAHLSLGLQIEFRPRMDDKQNHLANQSYRLPSIAVRMRIETGHSHRIIKNKLRCRKAQTVLACVDPVFVF